MKKLYLYAVFHANLQFSSIPEDQYGVILDSCLWPVLELAKETGAELGLEFPAYTLEVLHLLDPAFTAALADGWREGRWEVVGSGYSQTIFPLVPAAANQANLDWGQRVYREILGAAPTLAYINEQVFARGLVGLFHRAGYQSLFLDWDNAVSACPMPEACRYRSHWLEGGRGERLNVAWNSYIAFQRFQRYLHGEVELADYLSYLASHYSEREDRAFCFYGSDWEIFDYRPGSADALYEGKSGGREARRFKELLTALQGDVRFELVAPSKVPDLFPPEDTVEVCSASYPVPCKKQAKYNVSRWAVCGRENTRINTLMHRLYHTLLDIDSLAGDFSGQIPGAAPDYKRVSSILWRELCYLWGSDFRTFTTEEKNLLFHRKHGRLAEEAKDLKDRLISTLAPAEDFALYNPHSYPWTGTAFEFSMRFLPGKVFCPLSLELNGKTVPVQVEWAEYYRDGSLRYASFVISPYLGPGEVLKGKIVDGKGAGQLVNAAGGAGGSPGWVPVESIRTPAVQVSFIPEKGAAIKALSFPALGEKVLAGTLSHEFYDQMELSTDQFSGHTIIFDRTRGKVTDLAKVTLRGPVHRGLFPVRIPLWVKINTPVGEIYKKYLVYCNEPRLDVHYHFRFQDLSPQSLRLGMLTFNPETFEQDSLYLATVNGGEDIEVFPLAGARLAQGDPVDLRISSSHCLGATDGWVSLGDREKGVAIINDRNSLYSVPMVHYQETKKSYYLRVYNSLCEKDETSNQLWRGHCRYRVTYYGHRNNLGQVARVSGRINRGLLLIKKQ
ncbi:MAG: hypothetical protein ACYC38_05465 [Eubacteriales bacterium]